MRLRENHLFLPLAIIHRCNDLVVLKGKNFGRKTLLESQTY